MIQKNKYYFLLLICLIQWGCSKTVYVHSDSLGTSKYTLYKSNYKYEETSYNGSFSVWGKYEVKKNRIEFLCKDKGKVPYHYYGGTVSTKENTSYEDDIYVHVSNQIHKEPIVNANIHIFDSLGNMVGTTCTDLAGYALITPDTFPRYLQIEVFEHARFKMPFPQNADNHYFVALESLKPGGRQTDNCLSDYRDVLLEYKKDPKDKTLEKFERNGVVFVRSEKKP